MINKLIKSILIHEYQHKSTWVNTSATLVNMNQCEFNKNQHDFNTSQYESTRDLRESTVVNTSRKQVEIMKNRKWWLIQNQIFF